MNPQNDGLLIQPFPTPGSLVTNAFRELDRAANGTREQKARLGDPARLPRPWDPGTCTGQVLRQQLWDWLEAVVVWLNREYAWDVAGMIPTCWASHPHLIHEIAGLAAQRRAAGLGLRSDLLEDWHRSALPAFLERMRTRTKGHCEEGHQAWPGRSRYAQHVGDREMETREKLFVRDLRTAAKIQRRSSDIWLVDLHHGRLPT